jgi:hypothetical protein
LNIPLHVVATEIGTSKPAIWSSDTTPLESVAYAVRCSCTIPLFFQPVMGRFVDGGMVSNLPAFVVNGVRRGSFERVLCFAFAPDDSGVPVDSMRQDPEQYLLRLVAAIIDGSVTIQASLQDGLHVVEIGDLPLGTVDFDKVSPQSVVQMFDAGVAAARSFFDSEATKLQDDGSARPILLTEPQTLNQIVREEGGVRDEVTISLAKTRYVYNLFPTLLHWRLAGANLTFIAQDISRTGSARSEVIHERFRRLVLKCLGAHLVEVPDLPFEGVFIERTAGLGNAVILDENRHEDGRANFAVKYDKLQDAVAIRTMLRRLKQTFEVSKGDLSRPQVEVCTGGLDLVIERLRSIEQYSSKEVSVTLEEVDVRRIVFLTKYVKSYKYGQIGRLIDMYKNKGFRLFESVQVRYMSSEFDITMPLTPPVAEEHGGHLFLLEGNSRVTYLIREERADRVLLLVVRNVSARLPASGHFRASQLIISDEGKIGAERYEGWVRSDYRNIEEAVRRPALYLGVE